jgi:hypothetical protein
VSENSVAGALRRSPDAVLRAVHSMRARQVPLLMVGSVACGAALLIGRLNQGWFHHDDGSLAQSAERVLGGELPHRDFAELYTGLLTFLNAGVFALLGEDIFNLRIPLFALFLAFVACFFAIARRLVSPIWAFVATLAAVTWSVPVFPVPIPSWYLLFLSTFGTYALMRFFETRQRRWLLAAGACGGIGIAIKVAGIWFVIAGVLVLLTEPLLEGASQGPRRPVSRVQGLVVIVSAALTMAFVAAVMSGSLGWGDFAGLFVPVAALCGALAIVGWQAWHSLAGEAWWRGLTGDLATFSLGVLVPASLFVTPYVATASVHDLVDGVLIAPRSRFEFASFDMPHPTSLLWGVPVVVLFALRARVSEMFRLVLDVTAISIILFLLSDATDKGNYTLLWNTTRALASIVVVIGAVAIVRASRAHREPGAARLAPVALVAGFSMLIQFPFAAPVYFCYVAPLVLLAAIASLKTLGSPPGALPCAMLLALAVFGFSQLDHQSIGTIGEEYSDDPQVAILDPDRASVRVTPLEVEEYAQVRELVDQHRRDSEPIFAGPDAPEIYFLTRSGNVTPALIDFLDRSNSTTGARLIDLLSAKNVPVVVLNHEPLQSPKLDPETITTIRALYPDGDRVGRFEVRWKLGQ